MNITWVCKGDETGGMAQAVRGLTHAAKKMGLEVHLLCIGSGDFANEQTACGMAVEIIDLPAPPQLVHKSFLARSADYLRLVKFQRLAQPPIASALRRLKPDVVHVLWLDLMPPVAAVAAGLGVPCIWEMANALSDDYPVRINRRLTRMYLRRHGVHVLANSRYTAASLGEINSITPQVLYPGADESRFDLARVKPVRRAELGVPDDAAVFGIFSRVTPLKGHDRVLKAIAGLGAAGGQVHLLALGNEEDPEYAAHLNRMAGDLGLAERYHFLGYHHTPERYYPLVDVAVNSRIDAEPYGLSVVEAMMMGKPVLAHALGGPAETVLDGVTGWHLSDMSVEGVRAGILRALGDRVRWPTMGRAARRWALEEFSLQREAAAYLRFVRPLAGHEG